MVRTPGRVVKSTNPDTGKTTSEVRTFLWDNPELRRAFKEAKEKERRRGRRR